ncbi:type IV pilin protein [Acinetobacter venetianus]|jgi:type IV pilus assembly protein PilE|uniref:type IV pilin protein n=1 Tax=Acinetobacter venetianus TaxID=52133 RepID=UPI003F90A1B8
MDKIKKISASPARFTYNISRSSKGLRGFTLIELMVVLVIVAIFTAIAIPSYQAYVRRAEVAMAQQEMQKIAESLERHKARNFTYRGFDPSVVYNIAGPMNTVTLPRGATGSNIKYTLTIRDAEDTTKLLTDNSVPSVIRARSWAMKATTNDARNYDLLITSSGLKCKNKTKSLVTYSGCGSASAGGEGW